MENMKTRNCTKACENVIELFQEIQLKAWIQTVCTRPNKLNAFDKVLQRLLPRKVLVQRKVQPILTWNALSCAFSKILKITFDNKR